VLSFLRHRHPLRRSIFVLPLAAAVVLATGYGLPAAAGSIAGVQPKSSPGKVQLHPAVPAARANTPVNATACPRINIVEFKITGLVPVKVHGEKLFRVRLQGIIENYGDPYHGSIGTVSIFSRGAGNASARRRPGTISHLPVRNLGHNKRMVIGALTEPLGTALDLIYPDANIPLYDLKVDVDSGFHRRCHYSPQETFPSTMITPRMINQELRRHYKL